MHAIGMLQKWMGTALPDIHSTRLKTLFVAVEGLLRGQQLYLTALGRNLRSQTSEKHAIKRMDRLLGNHRLAQEREVLYGWLSHLILDSCRHPDIIVDFSDVDAARTRFILRAAVAVGGRALPLYEQVLTRDNHPTDTGRFLTQLAKLLPEDCTPIIVTDAGFRRPWLKAVEALGWYYVGRVRNREFVRFPDTDAWVPGKSLYAKATSRPRDVVALWLPRSAPWLTHAYLYRKHAKGRKRLTVHGAPRRNAASLKHANREREPWLLVSNLPTQRHTAKRVIAIYRERMSIELSFRDLKAHRHGFAFRQNLGRHPERLANLLLIAAIAVIATWLTGLVGIERGIARTLQANTEKRHKVLSVFFIGRRLLFRHIEFNHHECRIAIQRLQHNVQHCAFESI